MGPREPLATPGRPNGASPARSPPGPPRSGPYLSPRRRRPSSTRRAAPGPRALPPRPPPSPHALPPRRARAITATGGTGGGEVAPERVTPPGPSGRPIAWRCAPQAPPIRPGPANQREDYSESLLISLGPAGRAGSGRSHHGHAHRPGQPMGTRVGGGAEGPGGGPGAAAAPGGSGTAEGQDSGGGGKQVRTCPSLPSRGTHAPGGAPEHHNPQPGPCGSSGRSVGRVTGEPAGARAGGSPGRAGGTGRFPEAPGATRGEPRPPAGPPHSGMCGKETGQRFLSAGSPAQTMAPADTAGPLPGQTSHPRTRPLPRSPLRPSAQRPQPAVRAAPRCREWTWPRALSRTVQSMGPEGAGPQVPAPGQLQLPDNPKGLGRQ